MDTASIPAELNQPTPRNVVIKRIKVLLTIMPFTLFILLVTTMYIIIGLLPHIEQNALRTRGIDTIGIVSSVSIHYTKNSDYYEVFYDYSTEGMPPSSYTGEGVIYLYNGVIATQLSIGSRIPSFMIPRIP